MRHRVRHLVAPAALAAVLAASAGAAHGAVSTLVGTTSGYAGDGGPATAAKLASPRGVAVAPDGSLVIADTANNRLRRVTSGGTALTLAGDGSTPTVPVPGAGGDGGPAEDAQISAPHDVAVLGDGAVLVTDTGTHRIRRISPGGVITTVAGATPVAGLAGDGGPALAARLNTPTAIAPTADGGFLIADTGNHRIRRVGPDGVITTVAGTGPGLGGDGGPATAAQLRGPTAVTALPDGGFLIGDTGNGRVRRVGPNGVITTVAGRGFGFAGDGGPPSGTALSAPGDVLPLSNGGLLIADAGSDRLRRVTPLGAVVTVAGGRRGLAGDGGPTAGALFDTPTTLATAPDGAILVGDTGNSRVRAITDLGPLPEPEPLRTVGVQPVAGSVSVRPRNGAAQIPLREADLAPNLSVVEATRGTVRLSVRPLDAASSAVADVGGSRFTLVQPAGDTSIADLRLTAPLRCATPRARASAKSQNQARRRPVQRRIRIKVRGRYKTTGRYATAVANGTAWTITDRCDRTIIRVTEGTVTVRDPRRNRAVRIRAGRTYVALARPPARR